MIAKNKEMPGAELASIQRGPILAEHLVSYSKISGDYNQIHLDESFARQAGFPSVIVHGMLTMAFLADLLHYNFSQKEYRLQKWKVRFRKVTFLGDTIYCEGKVKRKISDQEFLVEVKAINQNGEVTADGEAQINRITA